LDLETRTATRRKATTGRTNGELDRATSDTAMSAA
jgi:hypothetical protein